MGFSKGYLFGTFVSFNSVIPVATVLYLDSGTSDKRFYIRSVI